MKLFKMKTNKLLIFFSSFPILFMAGGIIIASLGEDPSSGSQLIITVMVMANSFMMNTFSYQPASERISKITHALKVMGLRPLPYWLGSLIMDLLLKLCMCLILVAAIAIFGPNYLQDKIGSFFFLYMGFSFHMIILTYNISFLSNSINVVMGIAPIVFVLGFTLPGILNSMFSAVGVHILTYLYAASFVFMGPAILIQLGINILLPPEYQDPTIQEYGLFKESWPYALMAIVLGILLFLKLIHKDSTIFELKEKQIYKEEDQAQPVAFGEDLIYEKQRLSSPNNSDLIKVLDVQKVYPNGFKALHDLSFGVEEGQVFCLLGPNGAGKTTAFDIVTASIPKTQGTIELNGQELSRSAKEIFYESGICPQLNTLWDYLSARQHLTVYGLLKGMTRDEIEEAIQYFVKVLHFEEYIDRGVQKLSGGNKRKVCVAISMIGAPKFVFLDEPSTGMDPVARCHLWTLIKNLMRKTKGAMVLTTHYMQEAELVSDKLGEDMEGILVNGRFVTIGKMSELKKKFGEYSIAINEVSKELSKTELEMMVRLVLPASKMEISQDNEDRLIFKVPAASMKFAEIFRLLEKSVMEGRIKNFSVYTTTLEQIFLNFAKQQVVRNDQ